MRITTKGIVLNSFSFSEMAIVAQIYTEQYGMQSYIVNKVRSAKAINKLSFFQPFTIAEIEAHYKHSRGLQKLSKIQPLLSFQNTNFNAVKFGIAFFLSEMLLKCLRESEPNEELFLFLINTITQLHSAKETQCANFHLFFLLQLSRFLGFLPQAIEVDDQTTMYFDLKGGIFTEINPTHCHYIAGNAAISFNKLLLSTKNKITISRLERKELLNALIEYYSLHVPNMGNIKSLSVLEALFE